MEEWGRWPQTKFVKEPPRIPYDATPVNVMHMMYCISQERFYG